MSGAIEYDDRIPMFYVRALEPGTRRYEDGYRWAVVNASIDHVRDILVTRTRAENYARALEKLSAWQSWKYTL
jgi:hypothetical protein